MTEDVGEMTLLYDLGLIQLRLRGMDAGSAMGACIFKK